MRFMQTLRPDFKLFIHPVKSCAPFTATGRDDCLWFQSSKKIGLKSRM